MATCTAAMSSLASARNAVKPRITKANQHKQRITQKQGAHWPSGRNRQGRAFRGTGCLR